MVRRLKEDWSRWWVSQVISLRIGGWRANSYVVIDREQSDVWDLIKVPIAVVVGGVGYTLIRLFKGGSSVSYQVV